MDIQRGLVRPKLQQHQLVRVDGALEHLELLAARLLHDFGATGAEHTGQFGAFFGGRIKGDDKPY